jgi:hypothetical protein
MTYGVDKVAPGLRRYGFETKSVRRDGTPKYRYVLEHRKVLDVIARYGGTNPLQPTTGVTTG